jgi:F-type H+-transporting ATPase subunit b
MAQDAAQGAGINSAVTAAAPAAAPHTASTEAPGGELFPPFDAATFPNQLLWLAITFIALYVVMSRVALPRVGSIIDDRRARIDGDLAAADAARQQTDAAIAAYEGALAEARRKSQALADETRSRIRADIEARRQAVETDLAGRMTEAEARISATKAEALGHVQEIAVDTAQALVAQLIGTASAPDIAAAVSQAAKE